MLTTTKCLLILWQEICIQGEEYQNDFYVGQLHGSFRDPCLLTVPVYEPAGFPEAINLLITL